MRTTSRLLVGICFALVTACSGGGGGGSGSSPAADTGGDPGGDPGGDGLGPVPTPPAAAGILVFEVPGAIDQNSVEGYLVGYEDTLKVQPAADGKFYVNNVPSGKHDIIVTGGALAIGGLTLSGTATHGRRYNDVEFLAGVSTDKGTIEMPALGAISGTVTKVGQSNHLGIDVFVPGTSYTAKTDDSGSFTLSGVPVGTHNLAAMADGFHTGRVEDVDVAESATTNVGAFALAVDTGATGLVLLNAGAAQANSRTVSVLTGASEDTTLMQVSETNTFENASWLPLKASFQHTFAWLASEGSTVGRGTRTLYIRYANGNGLPTAPFSDSILVDIFGDGGGISINSGAATTALRRVTLGITVPANATQMRMTGSVADAGWISAASSKEVLLTGTSGTQTVSVQFKDADGFLSDTFSDSINLVMYTTGGGGIASTCANPCTTRTLNFNITVPQYATEMMISRNSGFSTGSWETVATTKQYTVTEQGTLTYYIKYRDADAVEFTDGTWQASVNVDLLPYSAGSLSIASNTKNASAGAPTFSATVAYPGNASQMRVAESSVINSASWSAVNTSAEVTLPNSLTSCGSKTIYLQLKDADGYVSQSTWSASVTYNCWNNAVPTTSSAPAERSSPAMVWTGATGNSDTANRLIVWGGYDGSGARRDGGIYNPATNAWTAIADSIANTPAGRKSPGAVFWTGDTSDAATNYRMLIWGCTYFGSETCNTGGIFDPSGSTWAATSTGANVPTARSGFGSVWTGATGNASTSHRMIVWGGGNGSSTYNSGAMYDPKTNTWTAMSATGAPVARVFPVAVWTGSTGNANTSYRMIVWGGSSTYSNGLNTGAVYDPATDSWSTLNITGAPGREGAFATVVGSKMFVFGGNTGSGSSSSAYIFDFSGGDFSTGTWSSVSSPGISRTLLGRDHGAIHNLGNSKVMIWGGASEGTSCCSVGTGDSASSFRVYDVTSNSWTSIYNSAGFSEGYNRTLAGSAFTGSGVYFFGGYYYDGTVTHRGSGGLFSTSW